LIPVDPTNPTLLLEASIRHVIFHSIHHLLSVLPFNNFYNMAKSIALIGSGIFAKEEHLPAIRANSSTVVLAAIYSRSLKSAKDLAASSSEGNDDVELYSDDQEGRGYEDLLKREDIKGVVIA
jgi:hypothetical protein